MAAVGVYTNSSTMLPEPRPERSNGYQDTNQITKRGMEKKPVGEAPGKLGPGSRYEGGYPKIIQKLSRKHKLMVRPNGLCVCKN